MCFHHQYNSKLQTNRSQGWYDTVRDEELGSQPCFFTSVTPVSLLALLHGIVLIYTLFQKAWNNANLIRLAEKIKSPLVLCVAALIVLTGFNILPISGHVRATTEGSLSLDNCHPFVFGKIMVRLSPCIGTFNPLTRHSLCITVGSQTFLLSNEASSPCYPMRYFTPYKEIQVWWFLQNDVDRYLYLSDSEWAFALFLSKVTMNVPSPKNTCLTRFLAPRSPCQVIYHKSIATGRVRHDRDPQ